MKKNILLRTNLLVCLIIVIGFLLTATLSYKANYQTSLENIEHVSTLTSEGIYYRMNTIFTKPINTSLTMANDSLLQDLLTHESEHLHDAAYTETIREYLDAYRLEYDYDSVFLVSADSSRYYNFDGMDRTLRQGDPENVWYYQMLADNTAYAINVDNDEVTGAGNEITVFVNCRIKNDAGGTLGIVGVGMRINYLQQLLQDYQDQFGVNAYLVNSSGDIEISTDYTGYDTVNLFALDQYGADARQEILAWQEDGKDYSFWDVDQETGEKQDYVVARYLPELQWHLVIELDTSHAVKNLNWQIAQTLIIIGTIILIVLFIITYVIRSFNKRIISLTQSTEQERRTVFEQATEQLFDSIYELDITHNRPANKATEQYFQSLGAPAGTPYDAGLCKIAEQIEEPYRQGYIDTFSPANVLQAYQEGRETLRYDFRLSTGGEYYWMRIIARIVRLESDNSIHMLTYRQNIDAEKRQERLLQDLAQHDEMTGLLTKTATQRSIDSALHKAPDDTLYAFFILDIDLFKDANDQYGHIFGDAVIQFFVHILKEQFRKDDIIGRIGGDEFAAFVPIPNADWAQKKAHSLVQALDHPYTADGQTWPMTASIGCALARKDTASYSALYEKADQALYDSKRSGRNCCTIDTDLLHTDN